MQATLTQLKKGIQWVLKKQHNPAGMLDLLISWAKYNYSCTCDNVSLKDILQEQTNADLVRTQKDAPVPGTANTAAMMLKKGVQRGTMPEARRMIRKTDGN